MNVLCIGAGKEQCYAIKMAQSQGLFVIAIDQNPEAEGLKIADVGIVQDIKEIEKVIDIAKKHCIQAVIPTPIGRWLTVVGAVNDALGLRGISYEAALNCTDKVRCIQALQKENVACAKQLICVSKEQIKEAVNKIGLPCILKPRNGSGSRGVITIFKKEELEANILEHLETKGIDDSIVEEFISGKEYGVDGIIKDGQFHLILIREKLMTPLPYRQEVGYFSPADLSADRIIRVETLLSRTSEVLKLNQCIIHADVILKDESEPYLIEIAGRPSGLNMSSFFVPYVTGINIITEGIKLGLGQDIVLENKENNVLVYRFIDLNTGYVTCVPKKDEIINSNIIEFENDVKLGDYIDVIKDGNDMIGRGFIISTGKNVKEALESAEEIINMYKIRKGRANEC